MLTEAEVNLGVPAAVINESAARLWPADVDPVGGQIRLHELVRPGNRQVLTRADASDTVTVVGVVGDTLNDGLRGEPQPAVLLPYTLAAAPQRSLAIRTRDDSRALVNAMRTRIHEMDRDLPLSGISTVEEILAVGRAQPRFMMALFSLFGMLGLALALAGIYSVLGFMVSRRTREIGVRIALGASKADVLRLILRTGAGLVAFGLIVGTALSLAATRLLGSQIELFRVGPVDPIAMIAVLVLFGVTAAFASYIPARRAAIIDPVVALRTE
jgi:putative ABC transport system permease protein